MTIHIPADALTEFCAEIFARVGCRSEEARRVSASLVDANLTGHDSHGVIRVPTLRRSGPRRRPHSQPIDRTSCRYASHRRPRRPLWLRSDDRADRRRHRRRKSESDGPFRDLAAQFRPCRPRRRMGGARRRGRLDLDPFRQCRRLDPGRAVRRPGSPAVDGALLRRHSAPGRRAHRPRLRNIAGRRRKGQRREPWRQAAAAGRVDRSRRISLRRSRAALWAVDRRTTRATTPAAPAQSAPSASIRAPVLRSSAS